MKTLKLVAVGIMAFSLMACSARIIENKQTESFQYSNYLDEIDTSKIQNAPTMAETAIDISDVAQLRDFHTNVFVGTVDSIDGCSTTIATGEFIPMPQTYGKITVLENLNGEVPEQTITFARSGGIISVADYEKNAPKELVANHEKHRNKEIDKENTYLNYYFDNDITIEAGKTYVFFGSFEKTGVFSIDGMHYGTREVVESSTKQSAFRSMPQASSLQLKNNDTGQFESFADFKATYFK